MGSRKERLSWRNSDDEHLAPFSSFYAMGLLIDTVFLLKYACLLA
ncbi:hypothetical protein COLO4_28657 [Corchorus olitorius]|uniref:Uncharacterized protein n=1 Tax=Corchorus olitorius TaxID=93759 RepID=A0A1R3HIU6_9ROSI|nr:hypothetical protein COLO4_28657 [Corchorus olitorius]